MNDDVHWTNKLPALVIGIALSAFSVLGFRKSFVLGLTLLGLGTSFIGYSLTIKDWCAEVNSHSEFSSEFAVSFQGCLREKGWFEF